MVQAKTTVQLMQIDKCIAKNLSTYNPKKNCQKVSEKQVGL
jgi:hypothetical protein